MTVRGNDVWVGQVSRGTGLKLSSKTVVTHKVDPLVDEARVCALFDPARSQYLARIAFVESVGAASRDALHTNYTEDPYDTEGLRAVLLFPAQPRGYREIEWLERARVPSGLDLLPPRPAVASQPRASPAPSRS